MKMIRALVAGAVMLALAGCKFITPGDYDAAMTIRKDGSFTYRYAGEIQFLTQSGIMEQMAARDAAKREAEIFDPEQQFCWTDDSEARPCTPEEIAEKQKEWEADQARKIAEDKKAVEMMKAVFGGMDSNDPATMHEFARRLQMQKGWKKVAFQDKPGLFQVEYEISGVIDRDFVFPVFDDVSIMAPFVQAARRIDGKVRVSAPAFLRTEDGDMAAAAYGMAMSELTKEGGAVIRQPNGTFTLTTDGEILTNNTEEGPVSQGTSKTLTWKTGPYQKGAPEALIGL